VCREADCAQAAAALPARHVPRAQTATNWLATPDGAPRWDEIFAADGYDIYLVDQPARGRSAWQPKLDRALASFAASFDEWLFTASAADPRWLQAVLHRQ
jgi:hypothetical protein